MQVELIDACEERGLVSSGTKHELVAALRQHFSMTPPESDAALVTEVEDGMDLVQHLTAKVSQLDEAIQTKTNELHSMHKGDRYDFACFLDLACSTQITMCCEACQSM